MAITYVKDIPDFAEKVNEITVPIDELSASKVLVDIPDYDVANVSEALEDLFELTKLDSYELIKINIWANLNLAAGEVVSGTIADAKITQAVIDNCIGWIPAISPKDSNIIVTGVKLTEGVGMLNRSMVNISNSTSQYMNPGNDIYLVIKK